MGPTAPEVAAQPQVWHQLVSGAMPEVRAVKLRECPIQSSSPRVSNTSQVRKYG